MLPSLGALAHGAQFDGAADQPARQAPSARPVRRSWLPAAPASASRTSKEEQCPIPHHNQADRRHGGPPPGLRPRALLGPRRRPLQGRRRMARADLRRGRRGDRRDRARPGRARDRARRPRLHPRQHAARVDARQLRDLSRRRRRGPDLPDQLAAGVRVGRRQLRGQGGDRARTRASARRSSRSATSCPSSST